MLAHFPLPHLRRVHLSRRTKIVLAVLLVLALVWVGYIAYQYSTTKKPITQLDGIPGVAAAVVQQPPGYMAAFYGTTTAPSTAPIGIALSPSGDRTYVTCSEGDRSTLIFDADGKVVGTLAPPNVGIADRVPVYVAVDRDGAVYVSDRLRSVIDRYSAAGDYLGTYQPAAGAPSAPIAMTFDKDGNFYVTNAQAGEHGVLVYNPAGNLKLRLAKEGPEVGEFSYPNGIVVDANGNIYVADSNNGRVQIFDPSGAFRDVIGRGGRGEFGLPRGLALDKQGRLYVVDTTGQEVQVWDVTAQPKRLYTIGSEGSRDGQFSYPNGAAVDSAGRVFVTDRVNGRVLVWAYKY